MPILASLPGRQIRPVGPSKARAWGTACASPGVEKARAWQRGAADDERRVEKLGTWGMGCGGVLEVRGAEAIGE